MKPKQSGDFDVSQIFNSMAMESLDKYLQEQNLKNAISYIVFEALAIEAYINHTGEFFYEDREMFLKEVVKTKPLLAKLDKITKYVTGDNYPNNSIKGWIEILFLMRNELAHAKTQHREIDLDILRKMSPKDGTEYIVGDLGITLKTTGGYVLADKILPSGQYISIHYIVLNTMNLYPNFFIESGSILFRKDKKDTE